MFSRLLFAVLLIQPAWAQPADTADPLQTRLESAVETYSLEAEGGVQALMKFASDFHVPIGIEWIKTAKASPSPRRSWQRTTPLEILQDIVADQDGYKIHVRNDVLHVVPS
jgi:hypothetical protein